MLGGLLPLAIGVALVWHYRVFAGRERRAERLLTDVEIETD